MESLVVGQTTSIIITKTIIMFDLKLENDCYLLYTLGLTYKLGESE